MATTEGEVFVWGVCAAVCSALPRTACRRRQRGQRARAVLCAHLHARPASVSLMRGGALLCHYPHALAPHHADRRLYRRLQRAMADEKRQVIARGQAGPAAARRPACAMEVAPCAAGPGRRRHSRVRARPRVGRRVGLRLSGGTVPWLTYAAHAQRRRAHLVAGDRPRNGAAVGLRQHVRLRAAVSGRPAAALCRQRAAGSRWMRQVALRPPPPHLRASRWVHTPAHCFGQAMTLARPLHRRPSPLPVRVSASCAASPPGASLDRVAASAAQRKTALSVLVSLPQPEPPPPPGSPHSHLPLRVSGPSPHMPSPCFGRAHAPTETPPHPYRLIMRWIL